MQGEMRKGGDLALFSYGTLKLSRVQLANYGRELDGRPDGLLGYRLEPMEVSDPDVVRVSGKAVHTIARYSGTPDDRIIGTVLSVTEEELTATDAYEVDAYERVKAALESGTRAFVYVVPPLQRR